jgi:hypothetical protein
MCMCAFCVCVVCVFCVFCVCVCVLWVVCVFRVCECVFCETLHISQWLLSNKCCYVHECNRTIRVMDELNQCVSSRIPQNIVNPCLCPCIPISREVQDPLLKTWIKGKFRPKTGHWGPEAEYRYSCTLPLTSAVDGDGSIASRPGRFTFPERDPVPTVREAGWVLRISSSQGFDLYASRNVIRVFKCNSCRCLW